MAQVSSNSHAQYRLPPQNLASIVDAPPQPLPSLSPDKACLLFSARPALPSIAEISRPEHKLAGIRFQPTFTRSRRQYFTGLALQRLPRQDEDLPTELSLPEDVDTSGLWGGVSTPLRIGGTKWAPDSDLLAFSTLVFDDDAAHVGSGVGGLRLAFADRRSGRAFGPVTLAAEQGGADLPLNAVLAGSTPFCWIGPRSLVALVATHADTAPPCRPATPVGPSVQSNDGAKKRPARTYQDLLKDAHDEATFRHYAQSSLVRVDLVEGSGAWSFVVRALGPSPGLFNRLSPSPDERFLLLSQLVGEVSFLFPHHRFPKASTVVRLGDDADAGEEVTVVQELPLAEDIPIKHNSCRAGRRALWWMEDAGARLLYLEACDGGDPDADMTADGGDGCRDKICLLTAGSGFAHAVELVRTKLRISAFDAFEAAPGDVRGVEGAGGAAVGMSGLMWEHWWKTRQQRCWHIDAAITGDEDAAPPTVTVASKTLLFDYSYEDRYANPGFPKEARSYRGTNCPIVLGSGRLLLGGNGASKEGDVPFLDIFDMGTPAVAQQLDGGGAEARPATGAVGHVVDPRSQRLFRSPHEKGFLEQVVALVCPRGGGAATATKTPTRWPADVTMVRVITVREGSHVVPNFFIRDIALPRGGGAAPTEVQLAAAAQEPGLPLTRYPHPYPSLQGISKRLCSYRRPLDGLGLTGTLYTPPGYDLDKAIASGGAGQKRLPLIIWAYPREFKDAKAAAQVRESPHCFSSVGWSSPLLWLSQGFAVLARAAMPIATKEGANMRTANDTFIEQLVSAAEGAVAHVCDELGVGDRGRVAVGGHSYGAFMTAHLLANSPPGLFRAGLARSGAYNRTLTPFGFQSEERTLWENPSLYLRMSPFAAAHKIHAAMLLIHGEEDENPGTFPQQSERMYNALKGHGNAPARLLLLPKEGHGYRARESIMHMLAESHDWLQQHCVTKPPPGWPPVRKEGAGAAEAHRRSARSAILLVLAFGVTATLAKL